MAGGGVGVAPELLQWAGFSETARAVQVRENLEVYDRVGGGDSFASGLIYGFLQFNDPQKAVAAVPYIAKRLDALSEETERGW